MSSARTATTTTTAQTVSGSVPAKAARLRNWNHLTDYELHHSQARQPDASRIAGTNGTSSNPPQESDSAGLHQETNNPANWPRNHRRIPQHRPINTILDQSQRRVYANAGERAFITVMFSGLEVNVVSYTLSITTRQDANVQAANRAWNATLGRLNGDWFKYKIGGEW